MTVTANVALRNAEVDAWGTELDSGYIHIYGDDGSQPVNPSDPPTGTVLCTIALGSPAYSGAASGSASTPTTIGGTGLANGSAAYAQQRNAANTQWQYASVSLIGEGGDVQLSDLNIVVDGTVTITLSTISQAASA